MTRPFNSKSPGYLHKTKGAGFRKGSKKGRKGGKVLVRFNDAGEIEDFENYQEVLPPVPEVPPAEENNFSIKDAVDEFYENIRAVNVENTVLKSEEETPKVVRFSDENKSQEGCEQDEDLSYDESDFGYL